MEPEGRHNVLVGIDPALIFIACSMALTVTICCSLRVAPAYTIKKLVLGTFSQQAYVRFRSVRLGLM